MRRTGRARDWSLAIVLLGAMLWAAPAHAAEQRLRVASILEDAFVSFLRPAELHDGASGPGLERLGAALDRSELPRGVLLHDRHLVPAPEETARAWGAVPVRTEVRYGGLGHDLWDEARWQAAAGERSLWMVQPVSRDPQEVRRLALQGAGALRQLVPYHASLVPHRSPAIAAGLAFLRGERNAGRLVDRFIAPLVDLSAGVGAIVAVNDDPLFADHVYLLVVAGDGASDARAVIAWRRRNLDRQAPFVRP